MYSVEEEIIKWFVDLGYDAHAVPPESGEDFLTVERTGGGIVDMIDHPLIALQYWAATRSEAEERAMAARHAALTGDLPRGVYKMEVNAGPYSFADADGCNQRYQIVLDVTCKI